MVRQEVTHRGSLARAVFVIALMVGFIWCGHAQAQGVSPNQMFGCNQSAPYDASTNGSTKLVTGVAGKRTYVCGFNLFAAGTVSVQLVYGTGGTCGTGTTAITPAFQFTAQTGDVDHLPVYTGLPPAPAS